MSQKHLNFIPADLRPRLRLSHEMLPLALAAVLVVYAVGMSSQAFLSSRSQKKELAQIDATASELHQKIALLSQQNKDLNQKSETLTSLQKVLNRKTYWSAFFKELSILIPDGIWLTSFSNGTEKDSDRIILRGESVSQELVAEFLTILEQSHHFGQVRIDYSEKEAKISPSRYKFEFSVPIDATTGGRG